MRQISPTLYKSRSGLRTRGRFFFFLLLLCLPSVLPAGQTRAGDCIYVPKAKGDNAYQELTRFENCGDVDEQGIFVIDKAQLKNILFFQNGLTCVYTPESRVFYVRPDGKSFEAYNYEDGCDYFSEGLARGMANGKPVFFNEKLEVVIEPPYEMLLPFENGYAAVCNGCSEEQVDEYTSLVGGVCGYIDRSGRLVVPLNYPFEALPPVRQVAR